MAHDSSNREFADNLRRDLGRKLVMLTGARQAGNDILSTAERQELAQLRRENRQLKMERDILAKATAWFAGRGDKTSSGSTNS